MTEAYIFQIEQNSENYDREYINYIPQKYIVLTTKSWLLKT